MLVPMLLGYVVGAVGIYTLLYKLSPMVAEDYVAEANGRVEVIDLFPGGQVAEDTVEQRKAA